MLFSRFINTFVYGHERKLRIEKITMFKIPRNDFDWVLILTVS